MKKYFKLIFTLLIICTTNILFSQQLGDNAKNVKGVKKNNKSLYLTLIGGPQFTDVTGMGNNYSSGRTGFMAGLTIDYAAIDNFAFGSGIIFDRRSFNFNLQTPIQFNDTLTGRNSFAKYDFNYGVDYLTIPVNVTYNVGEGDFNFFIQGTFYYSFFLTAHKKGNSNIYIAPDEYQYIDPDDQNNLEPGNNIKNYNERTDLYLDSEKFNNFDYGVWISLGIKYSITNNVTLLIAPGFTTSFGKILSNNSTNTSWMKNIKLQTGITYTLK